MTPAAIAKIRAAAEAAMTPKLRAAMRNPATVATHVRTLGKRTECHCCGGALYSGDRIVIRELDFYSDTEEGGLFVKATIAYAPACWDALSDGIVAYRRHRGRPVTDRTNTLRRAIQKLQNLDAIDSVTYKPPSNLNPHTYGHRFHVTTAHGYSVPGKTIAQQLADLMQAHVTLHVMPQAATNGREYIPMHAKSEVFNAWPTTAEQRAAALASIEGDNGGDNGGDNARALSDNERRRAAVGDNRRAQEGDGCEPAAVAGSQSPDDAHAPVLTAVRAACPWVTRLDLDPLAHTLNVFVRAAEAPDSYTATLQINREVAKLRGWDEGTNIAIVRETVPQQGYDGWGEGDNSEREIHMLDLPQSPRRSGVDKGMRVVVRRAMWDALLGRPSNLSSETIERLGARLRATMDEPNLNPACRHGRIVAYCAVTAHAVVEHDDGTTGHWSPGWLQPWNRAPMPRLEVCARTERGLETNAHTLRERLRQRRKGSETC